MLILPTKKKWFDMILQGIKREEYRDIKPYYDIRFKKVLGYMGSVEGFRMLLVGNPSHSFQVMFRNGYSKTSPSFIAGCRLKIGTGRQEWGAEKNKEYYVLHIDMIVWASESHLGGAIIDMKGETLQNEK